MSSPVYLDNLCLVDPTKTIKSDKDLLSRFLAAPDFSSRLATLQPVLANQFQNFSLRSLWPLNTDRKDGTKSELYRLAGDKAFAKHQTRKDIFITFITQSSVYVSIMCLAIANPWVCTTLPCYMQNQTLQRCPWPTPTCLQHIMICRCSLLQSQI